MREDGTLYDYWLALYRRRIAIILVTISATGFAYWISLALPPVYEAKVTFYLPVASSTPLYTVSGSAGQVEQAPLMPIAEEKQAGVHLGILKSGEVSAAILGEFPEKTTQFLRLNVDFVLSEHFTTEVYVRDEDPILAAAIANAYLIAYREFHRAAIARRSEATARMLERQIPETRQLRTDNLEAQQRLLDVNVSFSVAREALQAEYRQLTNLIDSMQQNLIEARLKAQDPAVELIVVERALVPTTPTFPRPILNSVVAFLLGLISGCYYALFLEYLQKLRRFRISRNMDMAPLEPTNGVEARVP